MKKIKLMIVYWDLDIGGIQRIIHDLVIYLDETHPEVEISILLRNETKSQIVEDIQKKTRTKIYTALYRSRFTFLNREYFFLWLSFLYLKLQPDIYLTFLDMMSITSVALRALFFWKKTKLVLNEGVVTSINNQINKKPLWFWNWCISFFYRHADLIIVPSSAGKTDLMSYFSIPEKKIRVGRNWTLLQKSKSIKQLYDLVYVGRFDKEKNTFAFIKLVNHLRKRFPNITLCLVGKGKEEGQLRQLVADNQLESRILFAGYQPNVVPYLNKSKIYVMTTNNEGTPVALLEANSQAIPSVVTRFVGSEEVVLHGKTGYIADSVHDMPRYIALLLRNSRMRKKMGIRAQQFIRLRYGRANIKLFVHYLLKI